MMKKSPYNLLQEIYIRYPWRILVCCMFLNQTSRKQVDKIRGEFFKRWPTAKKASEANQEEMANLIQPLGFKNKRSASIIKMSKEYVLSRWSKPIELHGIGQYAQDSWDMFVNKKVISNPSDKVLKKYTLWRKKELQKLISK